MGHVGWKGGVMARVLVVEDDAAINDVVATRLKRDGHAVTQAFSGSEARLLLGEKNEYQPLCRRCYLQEMQERKEKHHEE